ncbi:CDP-glycerol--glycerophosphate glycerophosphotransferase [Rummeliibacillus sp. TYF005]|uniref:CDP-glycerol glycerophosphotransferase family protein n=1 Tax=Rummeliibacillus sp. TYF005 TaxID=2058214 RepID=UPI000F529033|nr:CDP-glycerol glycerophosphotransferase family protein [Rummeliibacillus sp. TYF005]RPJ96506.1 CDP-glycerol--glycerophosphate glycerophosphotransferase [Rummeliibacillus sp. TYF005]
MRKEWLKTLFLFINRCIFFIFNMFPLKKKIVFLCDFGDNARFVVDELVKRNFKNIVVLRTSKCKESFIRSDVESVLSFRISSVLDYLRGLYHLATAKTILIDNYFALLSAMSFRPDVECIQLWHAAGAVKKFGMQDPSVLFRSPRAIKRFKRVYSQMNKVVVGSDEMVPIFKAAFDMQDQQILRTGIPRTDFFYDEDAVEAARREMLTKYPMLNGKKVILYAPTFRDQQLDAQSIPLNFEDIIEQLGENYIMMIKLHPAVAHNLGNFSHPLIVSVENDVPINKLLCVTDYVISDYSSIPFEFSLLGKPQIFYPYDIEKYEMERGFWTDYSKLVPGPVVSTDDELVFVLKKDEFDMEQVKTFSDTWNMFSDGHASSKLVDYLLKNLR